MIRLIFTLVVAYTTIGDPPKPRVPELIAQAQPRGAATLEIKAPTSVPEGVGFPLAANASGVKGLVWVVFPAEYAPYLIQIVNRDDEVNPAIFLWTKAGTYNFVVAGYGDGKVLMDSHTVTIGSGPGPVPPGPTPPGPTPPGPTPPPPPDPTPTYGLQAKAKGWAEGVTDSARAAHAKTLADQFDVIVNQIGAGTMRDRSELEKAFRGMSGLVLGWGLRPANSWRKEFLGPLLTTTAELFPDEDEQGNPLTHPMKDYAQAISEIAAGLRSVQ